MTDREIPPGPLSPIHAARRIGVLGGTLDPIHCGHLAAAVAARDAFDLPTVLVLPSRIPPHRAVQPFASPFHRFAMAALAVSGLTGLVASDDELRLDGPSYTADTLERLAARGYAPSQIFFITGADAFADIATWKRYPEVLQLANFVVVSRPGHRIDALRSVLPELAGRMHPAGAGAVIGEHPSIFLLQAGTPEVSSTVIRERLRSGDAITGLVPALVETHVLQHSLYQADQLHGQNR
jgi:nicotinate-nucleotide adenylyltransferase